MKLAFYWEAKKQSLIYELFRIIWLAIPSRNNKTGASGCHPQRLFEGFDCSQTHMLQRIYKVIIMSRKVFALTICAGLITSVISNANGAAGTHEAATTNGTAGTGESDTAGTGEHMGDAGAAGTDSVSTQRALTTAKYESANAYATAGTEAVQPALDENSTAPASGKSVDEATLTQAKYANTTGTSPTTDASTDADNSATRPAHTTQNSDVKTTATKTAGTTTSGTKGTSTSTSTMVSAAAKDFIQHSAVAQQHTAQVLASHRTQLQNQEARLSGLESSTNSRFASLNKQVSENRDRASAGIAGVAAMANIPQVTQGQEFAVGAGVGNTDGQSAVAVGASARMNNDWVVKASVANDTQHHFVVGAGASYGW